MTIRLGITGTIGSGKSLVGQYLEALGVPVLDTDAVVHQLYEDPERLKVLSRVFPDVPRTQWLLETDSGVSLNRQGVAELLFTHPQRATYKAALEGVVHPWVRDKTEAFLASASAPVVAVLVPLLFEAKSEGLYDEIWVVDVQPESVLIERLQRRHPSWSLETIQNRLNSQWPASQKRALADVVIDNSGLPESTQTQVSLHLRALMTPEDTNPNTSSTSNV
jgi:dephospho-CoA kinase